VLLLVPGFWLIITAPIYLYALLRYKNIQAQWSWKCTMKMVRVCFNISTKNNNNNKKKIIMGLSYCHFTVLLTLNAFFIRYKLTVKIFPFHFIMLVEVRWIVQYFTLLLATRFSRVNNPCLNCSNKGWRYFIIIL
jgi:hypothetical protein